MVKTSNLVMTSKVACGGFATKPPSTPPGPKAEGAGEAAAAEPPHFRRHPGGRIKDGDRMPATNQRRRIKIRRPVEGASVVSLTSTGGPAPRGHRGRAEVCGGFNVRSLPTIPGSFSGAPNPTRSFPAYTTIRRRGRLLVTFFLPQRTKGGVQ